MVGGKFSPPFLSVTRFLSPSMPITTRKSNADVHPGRVVLENQRVRCTKAQIEGDIASAAVAAIAASEEEVTRHRSIAEVEDAIEKNEEQLRLHANRPDLRVEPTLDLDSDIE